MIEVNVKALSEGLKIAGNSIVRRSHMPVLSHILIEGEASPHTRLKIFATNLTEYMEVSVPAAGKGAAIRAVVSFADLDRITKAAGKGVEFLTLSPENGLTVNVGRGSYPLKTRSAADFPTFPRIKDNFALWAAGDWIDRAPYTRALSALLPAVSTDEMRRSLTGVCFNGKNKQIAATDGHRLHFTDWDFCRLAKISENYILPMESVKSVLALLKLESDGVFLAFETVEAAGNETPWLGVEYLGKTAVNAALTVRCQDADFPDYPQVIPRTTKHRVTVSAAELAESLNRMSKLALADNVRGGKVAKFCFNGDLEIRGLRDSVETITSSGDVHKAVEMGFNASYWQDVLKAAGKECDALDIAFTGHKNPVRVTPHGVGFEAVIMPMELDRQTR